jgi:hypothetical protein
MLMVAATQLISVVVDMVAQHQLIVDIFTWI